MGIEECVQPLAYLGSYDHDRISCEASHFRGPNAKFFPQKQNGPQTVDGTWKENLDAQLETRQQN